MKKKCLLIALLAFLFAGKVNAAAFITRVDINYDTSKVRVSPAYTYNELRTQFSSAWVLPDDVNYSKGNNNIWFDYCPTSERCTEGWSGGYGENIKEDRYTWVNFEVFANPFGMDKEDPDYDFDKDHLDEIEIYVNGVKRNDAMIKYYNDSWRKIDVFIPLEVDTSSFVSKVKVKSDYSNVAKGETALFEADVESYGEGSDAVIWSVSENISKDTTINQSGLLMVAADEEAESLVVRATSACEESLYDEKTINVLDTLVVDSVSIRPYNGLDVTSGGNIWFSVTVTGNAPHTVIWSVSGNTSEDTHITSEGNLRVAEDETASSLTVTATSTYDPTKKASAIVTVKATTLINKIEFSYDTKEAYLTTRTTYNDARAKFKNNWAVKEDSGYSEGNNNIWINYCPTKEKCDLGEVTGGYEETILDRYTWVNFEIYSKPVGNESENPLYDFDGEHLENIEVWINGVKRTDVIVRNYNSSWRSVDVWVPMKVNTDKITQELRFGYDEYTTYYEGSNFTNPIYHTTGDGEITYSSSNPETAIVDANTGSVLPNDVGEAIIYATAAETEDYAAKTISYRLIIKRKDISPSIFVDDQVYSGSEIKPEVTVEYNEKILVKDVDYELTYKDNIDTGYGKAHVKSLETSKYVFENEASFYIDRKEITSEDVIVPEVIAYNDGNALAPNVTVKVNGKTLVKDTDYTISYANQTASIGNTVAVHVYGQNNYKGTITKQVSIEDPELLHLETPVIKIVKGSNNTVVLNVQNNAISATYEIYRSTNKNKGFTKVTETEEIAYTDSNLTYGTTYYYKVVAKNNYDKTGYSNLVSMKVLPDKVEELDALTIGTTQVKLGWTKNETVTGYEVYRSTKSNGRYTKIATTKNVDEFLNSRLSGNTNYYYKVRAYKTVGRTKIYGAYSNILAVKTAPIAPKMTLSVEDYDTIAVKTYSVKGAAKYEIYRGLTKNGEFVKVDEVTVPGNYKDSSLISGTAYFYKVRACNSNDSCGNYSSVTSKSPIPHAPSISLSTNDNKRVVINMIEVNGASGYEIYRSLYKNKKYTLVGTTENLEYVDEVGLNTRYYYKVRAYRLVEDKKIYGNYSGYKYITVSLNTPTIMVSKKSLNRASLSIGPVTGAAGYEVYRSTNKYRGYSLLLITDNLDSVDTLTLNTTYYYKVRAFIETNGKKYYSKYSALKSIKLTLDTPTFATNRTNLKELTLTINKVNDATGYEIYRSLYKNKKFVLVATTSELETVDNLNLNTTYYYKVRAYVTIADKKYYSNYSSLKTVKLVVDTPTFALTGQEQQVEVTINEVNYANGYEIYRATSKYGKLTKVGETTQLTYNDPATANKTYYYKIRAYAMVDEKKIYSSYSALKSVKTK